MSQSKDRLTVNSRKYDGTLSRSWQADIIESSPEAIVLVGQFESEVQHDKLGIIRRGTVSYEYYWLQRWYSVFRFHEPNGVLRNYYCNINMPPMISQGALDYVDLDIDVLVWPDFSYEIVDRDEFEMNAERFGYSEFVRDKAEEAFERIIQMVEVRELPFTFQAGPQRSSRLDP
jgi:protein associated with RNAse G/E